MGRTASRRAGVLRNVFPLPLGDVLEAVSAVAVSPDGTALYTAGLHVPLQWHAVEPGRAVERSCARAGTGLTREQWRMYVPDALCRRICEVSGGAGG